MKYVIFIFISLKSFSIFAQINKGQISKDSLATRDTTFKDIIALENYENVDTIFLNKENFHFNNYFYDPIKLYKSKRFKIGVYANKSWKLKKESVNFPAELKFRNKFDEATFAFLYTESSSPLDLKDYKGNLFALLEISINDPKIVFEQYRNVNGLKVLFVQMVGKIKRFNVTMLFYIYKDSEVFAKLGIVTKTSDFKYSKDNDFEFLNGLVKLP